MDKWGVGAREGRGVKFLHTWGGHARGTDLPSATAHAKALRAVSRAEAGENAGKRCSPAIADPSVKLCVDYPGRQRLRRGLLITVDGQVRAAAGATMELMKHPGVIAAPAGLQ